MMIQVMRKKVAEFEKTAEAVSTTYPRTDRSGDPECWAYWADRVSDPFDEYLDPDEEDWPHVK